MSYQGSKFPKPQRFGKLSTCQVFSRSHSPAWECRLDAPAFLFRNAGAWRGPRHSHASAWEQENEKPPPTPPW